MSDDKVIYETEDGVFRILEIVDEHAVMEMLKGDCFKPDPVWVRMKATILIEQRAQEERAFERKVEKEGVFGYVLEKWNAEPGVGYETVDSCYGFVGEFDEKSEENCHYIVEEMKQTIQSLIVKPARARGKKVQKKN